MSVEGVPFDQIGQLHIRMLYDNKVPEGRTLDYKQDVYEKENGELPKTCLRWRTPWADTSSSALPKPAAYRQHCAGLASGKTPISKSPDWRK